MTGTPTQIAKFHAYRVSGNTYAYRREIKQVGRWDAPSKTWIVETGGMRTFSRAAHILRQAERGGCIIEEL